MSRQQQINSQVPERLSRALSIASSRSRSRVTARLRSVLYSSSARSRASRLMRSSVRVRASSASCNRAAEMDLSRAMSASTLAFALIGPQKKKKTRMNTRIHTRTHRCCCCCKQVRRLWCFEKNKGAGGRQRKAKHLAQCLAQHTFGTQILPGLHLQDAGHGV